jgi:hypothetical protein
MLHIFVCHCEHPKGAWQSQPSRTPPRLLRRLQLLAKTGGAKIAEPVPKRKQGIMLFAMTERRDCFGTPMSRNDFYVTIPSNDCMLSIRDWEEGIFASRGADMIFLGQWLLKKSLSS